MPRSNPNQETNHNKPRNTQSNPDQTQTDTMKPKIKPKSHHHWPTQSNHHHPPTPPTQPKIHPTSQSPNPLNQSPNPLISQQTHANKVTRPTSTIVDKKKKREEEGFRNHQRIGRRPRLSSILAETEAETRGRDRAPFSLNHRQPSSWICSKPLRRRLRPRQMRERRKSDEPITKTTWKWNPWSKNEGKWNPSLWWPMSSLTPPSKRESQEMRERML